MSDILSLDAGTLVEAFRAGRLSPVEAVDAGAGCR